MTTAASSIPFSDAHHPAKKYCEWWYFTFFYGENDVIAGIFKIENKTPEIWVYLKEHDKKPFYLRKKFVFSDFSASQEHCDVKIGKNYFREKKGRYEMKIDLGKIKLKVEFKATYSWPDNIIERHLGGKVMARWIVPCPKGKFSGKLFFGGISRAISGMAFHDHVWHNINALSTFYGFKDWLWGISFTPGGFFLYASVNLGKKKRLKFVFSGEGDKKLKIVDDPLLRIERTKDLSEVKIIYGDKVLNKIIMNSREPIYQWGENQIIKLLIHRLLGLSQYHCVGHKTESSDYRHYLEILKKRS